MQDLVLHPRELRSSHTQLAALPALLVDDVPRSYKAFSFIDISQNNKEDSVKSPFWGTAEGVRDITREGSVQAQKL